MRLASLLLIAAMALAPPLARATDVVPPAITQQCGLYAYRAQITAVYDGDSVTADVDLGFNTWRRDEKLRLFGIDAPEVRGKARPAGLRARDALRKRIEGREVIVCTIKDRTGKYGRYLAQIWLGAENINLWLIRQGHAVEYDGGRRSLMAAHGGSDRLPRFIRAALK